LQVVPLRSVLSVERAKGSVRSATSSSAAYLVADTSF